MMKHPAIGDVVRFLAPPHSLSEYAGFVLGEYTVGRTKIRAFDREKFPNDVWLWDQEYGITWKKEEEQPR